jgi:hypothetical protein
LPCKKEENTDKIHEKRLFFPGRGKDFYPGNLPERLQIRKKGSIVDETNEPKEDGI